MNYGRVFAATFAMLFVGSLVLTMRHTFATEALIFLLILAWLWFVEINTNRESR
jgi:hypothetical protein